VTVREGITVPGWLLAAEWPGQAWPGVLLHRDAFLVRAPRVVLVKATGLAVQVDRSSSVGAIAPSRLTDVLPVRTAKVLEVDGWPDEPATAMVQLSADSGVAVSVEVNRAGFELAVRVTGDVWAAFESLGLVPDDLVAAVPRRDHRWQPRAVEMPASTTVERAEIPSAGTLTIETVSVEPSSWCDIFWWLG
jgi:hypothetical protein